MTITESLVGSIAKMRTSKRHFLQLLLLTMLVTIGYYWYVTNSDSTDDIAAEKFLSSSTKDGDSDNLKETKSQNRIELEKGAEQGNRLRMNTQAGNRLEIDTKADRIANSESTEIPPIIHRIFFNPLLVEELKGPVQQCAKMNPGFQHWFWSTKDVKTLMSTMYPEYRFFFFSLGTEQQKMIAARYFILNAFGGYVLDLDTNCRKSFAPLASKQCILAQENQITSTVLNHRDSSLATNFIACTARHPFIKELLRVIPEYTTRTKNTDLDSRVGTLMLNSVLSSYKQNMESQTRALLFIATYETFNPTFDRGLENHLRFQCQRPAFRNLMKLQRLCRKLKNARFANEALTEYSFTERLYVKSFKVEFGQMTDSDGVHVDIAEWLPNVMRGGNQVEAARKWQ